MGKPLRIVNDTNVWLSALYFSGNEAQVVHLIEEKQITSITSRFILDELREKMLVKFHTPVFAANATIAYIQSMSESVSLKGNDFGLRDVADNQVLETAVNGKSIWLITGDKDLLELKEYRNIQIVNASQFLIKYK